MTRPRQFAALLAIAALGSAGAAASAQSILFDNGGFVTHPGQGANGADASQTDNNFFGIGALCHPSTVPGAGSEYRIAEDFEVTGGDWTIDRIRVFAYATITTGTAVPPSPFFAIEMHIWDGHPRAAGSNIVATSTSLGDSVWTGVYRTEDGNITQDTRPIYTAEALFNGLVLSPGLYWWDVQITGGDPTAPFVKDGLLNADGNAMNLFMDQIGFNPMRYGNPQRGLAFPFVVEGAGSAACYADCNDDGVLNIDDFLCFIDAFAQSDPYADCDDNGIFNIDDFLCFINAFAEGCP